MSTTGPRTKKERSDPRRVEGEGRGDAAARRVAGVGGGEGSDARRVEGEGGGEGSDARRVEGEGGDSADDRTAENPRRDESRPPGEGEPRPE